MRSITAAFIVAVSLSCAGSAAAAMFYGVTPSDTRVGGKPAYTDSLPGSFAAVTLSARYVEASSGVARDSASDATDQIDADERFVDGVASALPEPTTWMLLGVGVAGVLFVRRRLTALG
jgi:PEP-CTERM motif